MIPEDAIWILELIRNRDARTEAEKDAVNAAIEALKAQLSHEGTTSDLISRQAAIDALDDQITQCDKALGSFDISMKDEYAVKVERASLKAYRETLNVLPSAQPEPAIPLSWIEKYIEWLQSFDNEFANLEAAHISVMVKKWRGEQHETD